MRFLTTSTDQASPGLECEGLVVEFGDVRAVDQVDASWETGAIHVVVGQNGAGKSTLAKVCAGIVTPTAGTVRIMGSVLGDGHRDAGALGLAMVHQHFILPPSFTVAEALEATTTGSAIGFFRRQLVERKWADHLRTLDIDTDPSARVRDLPIETRQQLEIARALAGNARVLVLDEPTAVLAPAAIERLFTRLRSLNESGVTLMLILHKLSEVFEIADTVSVLRDGKLALRPTSVSLLNERQLSDEMIGPRRGPDRPAIVDRLTATAASHRPKIELCSVTSTDIGTERPLHDVSLVVGEGRIVGVAGVEGNGQRRLASVVAGLEPVIAGDVRIDGTDVTRETAASRRRAGLCVVPFDRNVEGTSQTSRLWENFAVRQVLANASPWISSARLRASAGKAFDEWGVRYRSADQFAGDLSGGNVQRLILARELSSAAKALIAAHPTRGLDFMATEFVRSVLRGLADAGAGVLLISSDLDELFEMADELVVFRGGRLVESFARPYDRTRVGDAMLGVGSR